MRPITILLALALTISVPVALAVENCTTFQTFAVGWYETCDTNEDGAVDTIRYTIVPLATHGKVQAYEKEYQNRAIAITKVQLDVGVAGRPSIYNDGRLDDTTRDDYYDHGENEGGVVFHRGGAFDPSFEYYVAYHDHGSPLSPERFELIICNWRSGCTRLL